MLRSRVVRELLLDIASVRVPEGEDLESPEGREIARDELSRASRRTWVVVLIHGAAILLLFLLRDRQETFLFLGRSEETVFTVGVLLVAVHLGYRIGQGVHLRAIERSWDDLPT